MHPCNLVFLQLVTASVFPLLCHGKLFSCLCTTTQCQEQQVTTCNTTSMCFTQYLDRQDGSNPVVRGCITSKTPLLCENRRPAVAHANWPVLVCCNTNMCNQDVIPTPSSTWGNANGRDTENDTTSSAHPNVNSRRDDGLSAGNMLDGGISGSAPTARRPHIFSSVYIIVLVIGICCLIVIGAVAMLVLRRQSQFYGDDFGTIDRNGYLKGQRQMPQEEQDLQRPLPKVNNGTYVNKVIVNT